MNTFNTPGFETRTNSKMDLKNYYNTLKTQKQSLSQLNHPGKTFGDFSDFAYYDAEIDKQVTLIEVGNGEGAIRSSGYFPSYEYYTRALDKGWHVAPTNNQDNHKGSWFTSNDARTVIIAEDNSRESIYDAMRDKRVYASEDKNMTIDYTVNGEIMGSTISEADKLKFKIKINDPDNSDAIKKVSIIANGGVEVDSKEFSSNDAEWEFEISPEYSYYYVKVEQDDKDIAVSAPVWVGESLNVGLEKMEASSELSVVGDEVEISLGVYNNTSSDINNVKVELFKDEIKESNKIETKNIDILKASETNNVSFKWNIEKAGQSTIYARAIIDIDGNQKSITASIKVKAENPEDVYQVMIDGAHQNQYVSGNYAGKDTNVTQLLNNQNIVVRKNKELLTDESLKNISALIISNPQSTNYNDLTPCKFEQSEIDAIKRFTDRGGNLILTTVADYKDGKGEYSNNAQMNPILESIGSEIRINDDQVIDNESNGGQAYRLYFTNYDSPKYNLAEGIKNGEEQFSFYSGASIILADGAKGENVDFVVKGHDTSETSDADNAGDNVPVNKGEVNVLAAEELAGGGKVVVAGNTFFSDFEIDLADDGRYTNQKVLTNIMNWMLPEKEAKTVKIADLRIDENQDNVPDLLGEKFTIEGYVTSQSEAVEPKNSFFEVVYVEDETGGLCIFGVSKTKLQVGQKVRITGNVDAYQGEFELQIDDETKEVQVLDENIKEMQPTKLSTQDSMLPVNGGKLVEVQGKVVEMDDSNVYVDDGTGISRAYVEGYIWDGVNEDSKGKWDSSIKVGDNVSIVGLASMDPEGARLRVRNTSEIKKVEYSKPSSGSSSGSSSSNKNEDKEDEIIKDENVTNNNIINNTDVVIDSGKIQTLSAENWTKNEDGTWSILDNNGHKATGWVNVDNTWYALDNNGVMQTGWVKDNAGTWYYTSESGAMQTGWIKDKTGTWYYTSESGAMQTGWIKDKTGTWYYTNESGAMQTGWLKDKTGNWYYLNENGSMKTGWHKDDDGKWYYLRSSGNMAVNTTIDGYKIDQNGVWVK
jgi:glucan-binding YG repeat protein